VTEATAKKINVPMMVGSGGYADYMAFAKNGAFALGIKPVAAIDGKSMGVPGSTLFAARMRSASSSKLFEDPVSNLVAFKKLPESHKEAWPNVTWEKNTSERASTVISVLIPGSTDSKEGTQHLIANIGDKKLATKMVDYLEKIAGPDNFAIDRETAIAWFDQLYDGYAKNLQLMVDTQEAMTKELKATGGEFTMHADLLKKVYQATGQKDPLAEEPEEEEKIVQSDAIPPATDNVVAFNKGDEPATDTDA
jgi:hypothetical protein